MGGQREYRMREARNVDFLLHARRRIAAKASTLGPWWSSSSRLLSPSSPRQIKHHGASPIMSQTTTP